MAERFAQEHEAMKYKYSDTKVITSCVVLLTAVLNLGIETPNGTLLPLHGVAAIHVNSTLVAKKQHFIIIGIWSHLLQEFGQQVRKVENF